MADECFSAGSVSTASPTDPARVYRRKPWLHELLRAVETQGFCPDCCREVTRPATWKQVGCPDCGTLSYTWDLLGQPRLPGRWAPWFLFWGALPALLLLAGTLSPIAHPDSNYASIGTTLSNLALHGGPAILYGWSGFLLRYRRVRLWWLLAVPHGALMVVLNIALVAFLFPFVASLAR